MQVATLGGHLQRVGSVGECGLDHAVVRCAAGAVDRGRAVDGADGDRPMDLRDGHARDLRRPVVRGGVERHLPRDRHRYGNGRIAAAKGHRGDRTDARASQAAALLERALCDGGRAGHRQTLGHIGHHCLPGRRGNGPAWLDGPASRRESRRGRQADHPMQPWRS